jgi:hypothetical protein
MDMVKMKHGETEMEIEFDKVKVYISAGWKIVEEEKPEKEKKVVKKKKAGE